MKLRKILSGSIALSMLALTPAVLADDEDGEKGGGKGKGGERAEGEKGDRAEGERRRGGPRGEGGERGGRGNSERFREMLAKYDTDKDGRLSVDERVPMIEAMLKERPEMAERMKQRFDEDGDGDVVFFMVFCN